MERLLMPIEDGANALGVGRTTVYALVKAGELETVKIGRRSLITAESLREYVERLRAVDPDTGRRVMYREADIEAYVDAQFADDRQGAA
ncbi:MAG: helix-turn-helix domain-containing protein [Actinomycetota bacterium]|jgi:excisionase family DNA binding protein|nr:helix-turn-helix domain-containing protein [Actinomycetota bacterium]MDP9465812.1 helix-turn-helix domain-containing protein [Actinomycetota bacterium]